MILNDKPGDEHDRPGYGCHIVKASSPRELPPAEAISLDPFPDHADSGPANKDGDDEDDGVEQLHPDSVKEKPLRVSHEPRDCRAENNSDETGNGRLESFFAY